MTTAETVVIMRQHFLSGGIRPIATRIALLKNLKAEIKRREDEICAALVADFNKHPFDTFTTEIGVVYGEIDCAVKHLRRWSKPKRRTFRSPISRPKGAYMPKATGSR